VTFPVSIKGVVIHADKVLLLRNDREEWELPGGRLEIGETPEECVAREIAEETGWRVRVGPVLDTWLYQG
jgi:ADP-ribose pyrophosphatase YjhB (NUDIX family)